MRTAYFIVIVLAALWCAGFVLAPVLDAAGASGSLHRIYHPVCHQMPERSVQWEGGTWAVCYRCSSIYLGFLGALIMAAIVSPFRRRSVPLYIIAILSVPMLADGAGSLTPWYDASTISRVVTGGLFGIGMAALLGRSIITHLHSLFVSHGLHFR